MSNVIPPLLSSSPPPLNGTIEDEDDEFGDFTFASNSSYGCDVLSTPTPQKIENTEIQSIPSNIDKICNKVQNVDLNPRNVEKDFQDKRKESIVTLSECCNVETDESKDSNTAKCSTSSKYNNFQYFPDVPPDILPDEDDEYVKEDHDFIDDDDDDDDFQDSKDLEDIPTIEDRPQKEDCIVNEENVDSQSDVPLNTNDSFIKSEQILDVSKGEQEKPQDDVSLENDQIQESVLDVPIPSLTENDSAQNELQLPNEHPVAFETTENTETSFTTETEKQEDFGDFESPVIEPVTLTTPTSTITIDPEIKDSAQGTTEIAEDDFGNFEDSKLDIPEEHLPSSSQVVVSDVFSETLQQSIALDSDDDFGDFDNHVFDEFPKQDAPISTKFELKLTDDEDDDFGDFNDYSGRIETSQQAKSDFQPLNFDVNALPEKTEAIITLMFPPCPLTQEDYHQQDFTSNDFIFDKLKDATDTHALLYQWNKSNSQSCLLKSLNIDTRNILYGPRWNESMPRYAATLGFTPLEPVKSDSSNPTTPDVLAVGVSSSQNPSTEITPQSDIPSAQFDWVGSGLTNPLENSQSSTMLLDLEQLVASLDIQFSSTLPSNSSNSSSPIHDLDDWEFWLRLTPKEAQNSESKTEDPFSGITLETDIRHSKINFSSILHAETNPPEGTSLQSQKDNESVKSLQLFEKPPEETTNTAEENDDDDFNDFTTFHASKSEDPADTFTSWSSGNAVPLRETHIANFNTQNVPNILPAKPTDKNPALFDEPGWLKPTILTPDLPRKEIPCVTDTPDEAANENFPDLHTNQPVQLEPNVENKAENVTGEVKATEPIPESNVDDDEFTDFQSTLPSQPSTSFKASESVPATPTILEPLKPSILQPTLTLPSSNSTVINWPDPGVTDDDLKRIELFYKPATEVSRSKEEAETVDVSDTEPKSKANASVDDDDWSDFVSNQIPQSHFAQSTLKSTSQVKEKSRTSTPELQLSVPQLNQLQQPKKPAPLVTQQQTQLPSHLPIPPMIQPSSVQQNKFYRQATGAQPNDIQPSVISNQFAAQFGQGLLSRSKINEPNKQPRPNLSAQNQPATSTFSSIKPEEADDEWTDFVSSQPLPSVSQNGLHASRVTPPKLNFDWNGPPQFTSWSANVTPNIITNPVSLDTLQNYSVPVQPDLFKNKAANRKTPNVVIQSKKNTIPSISAIPDMEFIAPKNKAWKK